METLVENLLKAYEVSITQLEWMSDDTREQALDCLKKIREEIPGLGIKTHMMVGFPSETPEDFSATLKLMVAYPFSGVDIYTYSDTRYRRYNCYRNS